MSADKEELELDEDFVAEDADDAQAPAEVAKTNLTKRRIIDNFLDERRLHKQIAEYDFEL